MAWSKLYDKNLKEPFKLSRTKIENFIKCPRCFYLDRKLGIAQPPGFPFTLNSAVDTLLKKEFDIYRAEQKIHPLMEHYGLKAVPFRDKNMDQWRENFVGVQFLHKPTNFLIFGAVDDIWINENKELIVVDYKATSSEEKPTLDVEYRQSYKRQMEIYQWLLRQNNYKVSNIGYFVYANGKKDLKAFDGKLEFDVDLLDYTGDDSWVEQTLLDIKKCLDGDIIPGYNSDCDFCKYQKQILGVENKK